MKKLIIKGVAVLIALAIPVVALAVTTQYDAATQAKWCWNTGTYWNAQRAQYPDYYAKPANIAKYSARYGTGTPYCPL